MCFAWQVLGEETVHATSTLDDPRRFARNPSDDRSVVTALHGILSTADIIVAHNGNQYDIKFAEARMLYHGLPPLPPILKIDTLKVARERFLFNANNLDYLGKFLGVGRKKPTMGGLWLKVLQGDRKAIQQMVVYNKQDVKLLGRVFAKLRPYTAAHPNLQLFKPDHRGCPRCGSVNVQRRGFHRALTQVYQKFVCLKCGGWYRTKKAERGTTTRTL